MIVNVTSRAKFAFPEAPCALALPVFEDTFPVASPLLDEADARTLGRWHEKGLVRGKAEEVHFLPSASRKYEGVLLLSLGKRDACSTETLRRAAGQGCAALNAHRLEQVVFDAASLPELAHGVVEGLLLGQYRFDPYKEHKPGEAAAPQVENITVVLESEAPAVMRRCEQARLACESANWARDLANTPPNDMTPSRLAGSILEMAEDAGWTGEVFHRDQLEELGMRAFLGVARGSVEPPTLTVLHYGQESAAQTIALVGKGITFDTGGISLKPGQGMHEMKFDMCGAAAVAGAFRAIAALRPALNVVCVIPACENAPGGHAQRPGDIVRAYNGKTIEVHNTDAEGRLLLADALAYTVDRHRPDLVVDLATLTGACVVALGHYAAGLMTDDEALAASLDAAGTVTGERVWRLPLWDEYGKLLEGTHAELCNIGPPREAGAIMGGCFLKHFVGDTPWAHLDIAGTAWGGKHIPYLDAKHATGYGVRLLTEWVVGMSGEAA